MENSCLREEVVYQHGRLRATPREAEAAPGTQTDQLQRVAIECESQAHGVQNAEVALSEVKAHRQIQSSVGLVTNKLRQEHQILKETHAEAQGASQKQRQEIVDHAESVFH